MGIIFILTLTTVEGKSTTEAKGGLYGFLVCKEEIDLHYIQPLQNYFFSFQCSDNKKLPPVKHVQILDPFSCRIKKSSG